MTLIVLGRQAEKKEREAQEKERIATKKRYFPEWFDPPGKNKSPRRYCVDGKDLLQMLNKPEVNDLLTKELEKRGHAPPENMSFLEYLIHEACDKCQKRAEVIGDRDHEPLTVGEQLPIALYTTEVFYKVLNEQVRRAVHVKAPARRTIKQNWSEYVRSMLTSLRQLAPYSGTVYRGVPVALEKSLDNYVPNTFIRWHAFNSCAKNIRSAVVFAHKDHLPVAKFTVFRIKCYTAKDISEYSVTQEEQEVLLEPNTLFYVTDTSKTACCPKAALYVVLADMICSTVWASLFSSCCGARRAPGPQPHPPSNTQCSHTHTVTDSPHKQTKCTA